MKIKSISNALVGATVEILYALVIILAAFLICVAAYFVKL